MPPFRSLFAALWLQLFSLSTSFLGSVSTSVLLVNRRADTVRISASEKTTVGAGGTKRMEEAERSKLKFKIGQDKASALDIPVGSYAVVIFHDDAPTAQMLDVNDLQLGLSVGAHLCPSPETREKAKLKDWMACVAKNSLGGLPEAFTQEAFTRLWLNFDYWRLCEVETSAPSLRNMVAAGYDVDVLHEEPLIVSARGFLSPEEGVQLMTYANLDSLTRAHVGTGGGSTSTSEQRETLTANFFVNWGKADILSLTAAKFFDLSSDLLSTEVPYEGQEPVNFLHYLKGFEYKPHTDGSGERTGKRVATTLLYCQAADEGGSTVFPSLNLKFTPRSGDLLFFQYQPKPSLALHAACPVIEGNKSTLTQWHRLGVSIEKPWDNYEDWGKYHNPYGTTRWKGNRYGQSAEKEL